jgi:hypothetical protein
MPDLIITQNLLQRYLDAKRAAEENEKTRRELRDVIIQLIKKRVPREEGILSCALNKQSTYGGKKVEALFVVDPPTLKKMLQYYDRDSSSPLPAHLQELLTNEPGAET